MKKFAACLSKWFDAGNTQVSFANLVKVSPGNITRWSCGEAHPSVTTFEKILSTVAPEHPQLARDLLEAYLLDHIPEGNAPDGRPWTTLVRIMVEEITPAQLAEGIAVTELELAKAWWTKRTETPDGQRWLLTLYRWSQPKVTLYQKPDRNPPKRHALHRPSSE